MRINTRPGIFSVPLFTIVAVALLAIHSTARAEEPAPVVKVAPSVAEMLQRKQQSQLRDQLVKEGRWDEVRQMDEEQARLLHERQQKVVAHMNEDLSRAVKFDVTPTSAVVDACDKETLRMREANSSSTASY
jgi:hypothetical protein